METLKSSQEQRIQQCLSEISLLQSRLRETALGFENIKSRLEAEKGLNLEIRMENMKLKEDLSNKSSESEEKDEQIKDLRSNIKNYVTEVKRIEEVQNLKRKITELQETIEEKDQKLSVQKDIIENLQTEKLKEKERADNLATQII